MEEEFTTFTTPPSTLTESQLIQIQLYGKLVFSETISLDAKSGNQTLMILEALNNANDFTPERFTETISALLKKGRTPAGEAIKANLLQKAKNAITEEHKEQRLQYNEQHQANNIVAIQIYTYLNTDVPASSVDGIVGKNTREAQNILKGQKATTENGKQLYANHHKLKEEVHNHQQRSKEYLKSTPTSTKSMNETSIFDIRGNTTLTTFLQKQGETDIPTSETFQQRHNEATRTVILQSLTELLGEGKVSIIKPFLDEKGEINNLESLKTTLTTLVNEEEI
ncbi:MAG: hypothetical protein LBG59_06370 [Candidatus Peribacteria bacterium]|jgi:hypothetical protein|nr:hypothetical protein [Candidatus Peribacteria bacterium]